MNENEIEVLLDHFVGALDSSESASVAQKINTLPLWSKTYKQINLVFGSLNAVKQEDNQRPAPEGLANKTFQAILEQKKTQESPNFIAQKAASTEQPARPTSRKRFVPVKPSFLALSACTGFLLVFVLAAISFNFQKTTNIAPMQTPGVAATNAPRANGSAPINSTPCANFAVTGASQQPSKSLFFCSDSVSGDSTTIPFTPTANNLAVNAPQQMDIMPVSNSTSPNMSCPDNFAVIVSMPEDHPVFIDPYLHCPNGMRNVQNVVAPTNVNFAIPVNYQNTVDSSNPCESAQPAINNQKHNSSF